MYLYAQSIVDKIDRFPPEVQQLITDAIAIDKLLAEYESNHSTFMFKDAAFKLKTCAPLVKKLATDDKVKDNEDMKVTVKKLVQDLKSLFRKAKDVH